MHVNPPPSATQRTSQTLVVRVAEVGGQLRHVGLIVIVDVPGPRLRPAHEMMTPLQLWAWMLRK
jgi:hypothetical protein